MIFQAIWPAGERSHSSDSFSRRFRDFAVESLDELHVRLDRSLSNLMLIGNDSLDNPQPRSLTADANSTRGQRTVRFAREVEEDAIGRRLPTECIMRLRRPRRNCATSHLLLKVGLTVCRKPNLQLTGLHWLASNEP